MGLSNVPCEWDYPMCHGKELANVPREKKNEDCTLQYTLNINSYSKLTVIIMCYKCELQHVYITLQCSLNINSYSKLKAICAISVSYNMFISLHQ